MKLSKAQANALSVIKDGALRSRKGYYYYAAHTSVRRSGEMKVSRQTIDALIKNGLITKDQLPNLITH